MAAIVAPVPSTHSTDDVSSNGYSADHSARTQDPTRLPHIRNSAMDAMTAARVPQTDVRPKQKQRMRLSVSDLIESKVTDNGQESSQPMEQISVRPPPRQAARSAARSLANADEDGSNDGTGGDDVCEEVGKANVAGSTTKRKSRVLRRKTDHSVIERRRREKINERLIRLQDVVPACREEVFELLEKKPPKGGASGARAAAKLTPEQKKEQMETRCREEMVLEKLCIISHTVDYVMELRSQVAAYRKLCQCDPPVDPPAPRDPRMHAKFAHEHGAEELLALATGGVRAHSDTAPPARHGSVERSDFTSASKSSDSPPWSADESTTGLQATGPAGIGLPLHSAPPALPKRKRHWGSNRPPRSSPPPKKSKISGQNEDTCCVDRTGNNAYPQSTQAILDDEEDDEDTSSECLELIGPHTTDCAELEQTKTGRAEAMSSGRRRISDPAAHYRHHYMPAACADVRRSHVPGHSLHQHHHHVHHHIHQYPGACHTHTFAAPSWLLCRGSSIRTPSSGPTPTPAKDVPTAIVSPGSEDAGQKACSPGVGESRCDSAGRRFDVHRAQNSDESIQKTVDVAPERQNDRLSLLAQVSGVQSSVDPAVGAVGTTASPQ